MKVYSDYLLHTQARQDHPARSIRLRDTAATGVQLQDLLTGEEIDALPRGAGRYQLLAVRHAVVLGLLLHQALRATELAALRVQDLDLKGGRIWIEGQGKHAGRRLTLDASQVLLLHNYTGRVRPRLLGGKVSERLLISSRGGELAADDLTKQVLRHYKDHPKRVSIERIRQSVLARKLAEGGELRSVQVFAGHRSVSSTERYRETGLEVLSNLFDRLHPLR